MEEDLKDTKRKLSATMKVNDEKHQPKKKRVKKSETINPPQQNLNTNANVPSSSFATLLVDASIHQALHDMGFATMTPIQSQCIPHSLLGRDILASAKTGSGKTLAFLIPGLQFLINAGFQRKNGTGVLIITPTRELAIQIFGVATDLFKFQGEERQVAIVLGGTNKDTEESKLKEGCSMVIGTPGRLIDHMRNTKCWKFKNLRCVIIDEADRMLDVGFEAEMKEIISLIPKERQTLLFSATQTNKVRDLAKLSLTAPVEVHVDSEKVNATAEGLEQGYVVCEPDVRFRLLYTFLKKNSAKKIIVFLSSCASVTYHEELLNYIDLPVLSLHGKQKQAKRARTFFEFNNMEKGVLICTDVAARGLDIPKVDWIIQYDPPNDPKEYIHRVGRTARGVNGTGKALLFLLPQEIGFLQYLKDIKVPLEEYEFPENKIANIQLQLEHLVETIFYLNQSARAAYQGYLKAYVSHSHREIFDVNKLDCQKTGLAFGLTKPPHVDLFIKPVESETVQYQTARYKKKVKSSNNEIEPASGRKKDWKEKKNAKGHFSASNPYGKKQQNDNRSFSK